MQAKSPLAVSLPNKIRHTLKWLPAYIRQRVARRIPSGRPLHLLFALADHFEPAILPGKLRVCAPRSEQERRLKHWCQEYPKSFADLRDSDGRPFRHTYFSPADQYEEGILGGLIDHCRAGWGEIEIHLHHGLDQPDTAEGTRQTLSGFRDTLVSLGCLSRLNGTGPARYAFVHGNWALANSALGRWCGVDNELQVLAETGCFADFTLPSAPNIAQITKINSLYESTLPLSQRAAHREGRNLRVGHPPTVFPLLVQGPLMLNLSRLAELRPPGIENSELAAANPPTLERLHRWRDAAITVEGRPDWLFIKLHCHGMTPHDEAVMLGEPMRQFLQALLDGGNKGKDYRTHFLTAREMVNIILALCDGREGSPEDFRDYRFKLITAPRTP